MSGRPRLTAGRRSSAVGATVALLLGACGSATARVTTYDGGHGPLGPRVEAAMLPFFAEVLVTEG